MQLNVPKQRTSVTHEKMQKVDSATQMEPYSPGRDIQEILQINDFSQVVNNHSAQTHASFGIKVSPRNLMVAGKNIRKPSANDADYKVDMLYQTANSIVKEDSEEHTSSIYQNPNLRPET